MPGCSARDREPSREPKRIATELLDILARPAYQAGHIRQLCTNPLLLTILCVVFHEERKLPTGRAELYAHCVRVFLEYWRHDLYTAELETGLKPYDAEAAQSVLARVAWWMHQEQNRTAAPLQDLAAEATKGLANVSPSSGLGREGPGFLERMRDETGILAMGGEGEGRCGFLHLSFQEYLAADHAAREGLAGELASRATESWWREVALLSLRRSRPFCEAFFHEMLQVGIAENHPDLAQRCLAEALYFASGPFVETLDRPRPKEPGAGEPTIRGWRPSCGCCGTGPIKYPRWRRSAGTWPNRRIGKRGGSPEEILIQRGVVLEGEPRQDGLFVDQRTGITYVAIPAGEFAMGSDKGDEREKPVHRVRISQPFSLGKYPVTHAQYARFLDAMGNSVRKPASWDNGRFNQPEQPVVGVSWDEAKAFCEWAGGRLPTEAEWEYACRAGTTTEYSFGDDADELGEYGWFGKNSGGQTQPVGAKKPNTWGLHDMHGNVWEWCQDWYSSEYYAHSPDVDPTGPAQASVRVFRGGSWRHVARFCRSALRFGLVPGVPGRQPGLSRGRSSAASDEPSRQAEPGA